MCLEHEFWQALYEIAAENRTTRSRLISRLLEQERDFNFTSTVRVFVLRHFRRKQMEQIADNPAASFADVDPKESADPKHGSALSPGQKRGQRDASLINRNLMPARPKKS